VQREHLLVDQCRQLQQCWLKFRRYAPHAGCYEDTHAVSTRLFTLVATAHLGGRQIHDANIVATMATYGIRHLLTHNVADFNRFAAVITIIPLSDTVQP